MRARVTEPASAAIARLEFRDDLQRDLFDADEDHLRDALAGLHLVGLLRAIPAGDENLPLR